MRTCLVCGKPIGEDNLSGIGSRCMKLYSDAYRETFFHFHGIEYHIVGVKLTIEALKKFAKNKKFRSSFRKEFIPSIIAQYGDGKNISKKQVEVSQNIMNLDEHSELLTKIRRLKKDMFSEYVMNNKEREFFITKIREVKS